MRLSIKTKQVLGVTSTVGAVVIALSLYYLSTLARVSLDESQARCELLARAIYQRAQAIVPRATDPYVALRTDGGLKSILESSIYSRDVTDAAVVDPSGKIVATYDPSRVGKKVPKRELVQNLLRLNRLQLVWAIFTDPGRELEVREPLTLDTGKQFGAIHIGISTLLIRKGLRDGLGGASKTVLGGLVAATLMAMLLAQLFLRPIHVLRSGLSRLQRGETGITLDLPKDEFGDLGTFFSTVSAKLSADRTELAGQKASLESVVERLEDAVALFDTRGEMLFANPSMRALLPVTGVEPGSPEPWRELVRTTLATRQSHGPVPLAVPETESDASKSYSGEWLLLTHAIQASDDRLLGVMLIGRNVGYLSEVQSTLRYSRKLTALGRLSAGVAHEVKNPLNAMMIHLELLRQKLSGARRPAAATAAAAAGGPTTLKLGEITTGGGVDVSTALEHVGVIASEIKRLDQVLQGFLKFSRPEDLRLQPVQVANLIGEVVQVVQPEADKTGIRIETECPPGVPDINGDAGMLRQALLNLAINACQSMPHGGTLRFRAKGVRQRRVEIVVEDTGVGIRPEHLQRIFDLYFTTREKGSGIGLSMVYRTAQLHDGEVEVQSTLGVGTMFRLLLPRA
jgi:signal transduction histidine kinase